jgi:hypothetical protein
MKIRSSLSAIALAAAFLGNAIAAFAQQQTLTLYQGAQLNCRMATAGLSTGSSHVGDRFTMDVVPPYPSGDPAYQGAVVIGEVTSVEPAGQGRKPQLGLALRYLRLSDGRSAPISASITSQQNKSQNTGGKILKTAAATLGGMLVGNAIGKTLFGISGGGAVGAAGGLLYGLNSKQNFEVPQGSNVQITMNQTVTLRRQASSTGQ